LRGAKRRRTQSTIRRCFRSARNGPPCRKQVRKDRYRFWHDRDDVSARQGSHLPDPLSRISRTLTHGAGRHCERSNPTRPLAAPGVLRRCAPRKDGPRREPAFTGVGICFGTIGRTGCHVCNGAVRAMQWSRSSNRLDRMSWTLTHGAGCHSFTVQTVIARSKATKQSRSSLAAAGLLRFARKDGACHGNDGSFRTSSHVLVEAKSEGDF
jgi:hypothetical protein